MSKQLLREYLVEVMLAELRLDVPYLNHLRKTTGAPALSLGRVEVSVADDFIEDVEDDLGKKLHPNRKEQVRRFVARRMPALIQRYRGNSGAAEQTMYNILNTRFNDLRMDYRR